MPLSSKTLLFAFIVSTGIGFPVSHAEAGPLIDWLFGRRRAPPAYAVGQPVPVNSAYAANYGSYPPGYNTAPAANGNGYAANYGTYYNSQLPVIGPGGAGYTASPPSGITAATLPSTMTYVPNYRSNAYRAPVTYYRPLLTTDPNTGAQVVVMAPCTSYEYLTQRTPTFGRSALFGSTSPPAYQIPPAALPTYTLPSGGVPLAYSAPSTSPYTTGYGSYSTLQPPVGTYPSAPANAAGTYPTAPQGTPYYGSSNGGSCGGYVPPQTVPGLVAPQAPNVATPSYSQPSYQPSQPSYSPSTPNGVYPPSGSPGTNPADIPPSLPPTFPTSGVNPSFPSTSSNAESNPRPQLRSIVRQPMSDEQPTASNQSGQEDGGMRPLPTLKPIPVPDGFERQPRWNPGLLREEDMTAMRPVSPAIAQYSGQSKTIQWASFERPQKAEQGQDTGGLRPIIANRSTAATEHASQDPRSVQKVAPTPRKTGGWQATR